MSMYFIQPADLLFFKDGRELQAGTEYSAESIFPPMPATLYGALRSRMLMDQQPDWATDHFGIDKTVAEVLGTKHKTGNLTITGFMIGMQHQNTVKTLFPMPLDVTKQKSEEETGEEKEISVFISKLVYGNSAIQGTAKIGTNLPPCLNLSWIQHSEKTYLEHPEGFLFADAFKSYLKGKLTQIKSFGGDLKKEFNHFKSSDVIQSEPRMHVVIDDSSHASQTGKLFTIAFQRFAYDFGFVVGIEPDHLLHETGLLRLGGESRPAQYSRVSTNLPVRSKIEPLIKNRFKLVTTTPSVFLNGWIPDGINADGIGEIGGCKVRMIGASCGRYIIAGGWDLAQKKPKTSFRAVPPGAVYHFELLEGSVGHLFDNVFGKSICTHITGDSDENEFQKQGFGITYIGVS